MFSSRGIFGVPKEYDSEIRMARVSLWTRPVEMLSNVKLPLGFDPEFLKHWAVVFHFEQDDRWCAAEGFRGDGNKLIPNFLKYAPEDRSKYTFYDLGTLYTSPKHIRECVVSNEKNGETYKETLNNCQHWAKALVKKLDQPIMKKMDNFKTLKEFDPFIAYVGAAVTDSLSSISKPQEKKQ